MYYLLLLGPWTNKLLKPLGITLPLEVRDGNTADIGDEYFVLSTELIRVLTCGSLVLRQSSFYNALPHRGRADGFIRS